MECFGGVGQHSEWSLFSCRQLIPNGMFSWRSDQNSPTHGYEGAQQVISDNLGQSVKVYTFPQKLSQISKIVRTLKIIRNPQLRAIIRVN